MLISDSSRLLFVHVQKTGGSTVQRWLEENVDDARGLPRCHRHAGLGPILDEEPDLTAYLVLGFVRNPWSRMLSWHRMIQRWAAAVRPGEPLESVEDFRTNRFARRVARELPDFESFVLRGPAEIPRLRRPQVSYLEAGGRRADLVGRQERLEEDLAPLRERLGFGPLPAERHNADVERVDYRDAYTPRMRDHVGEVFARDVEELGYEF